MSYWVVKNFDGDAIGILDEEPKAGIEDIENEKGISEWVGYIRYDSSEHGRGFFQFNLGERMDEITPITKEQYETYKEFGLFDE